MCPISRHCGRSWILLLRGEERTGIRSCGISQPYIGCPTQSNGGHLIGWAQKKDESSPPSIEKIERGVFTFDRTIRSERSLREQREQTSGVVVAGQCLRPHCRLATAAPSGYHPIIPLGAQPMGVCSLTCGPAGAVSRQTSAQRVGCASSSRPPSGNQRKRADQLRSARRSARTGAYCSIRLLAGDYGSHAAAWSVAVYAPLLSAIVGPRTAKRQHLELRIGSLKELDNSLR